LDGIEQRVETFSLSHHALPRGQGTREDPLLHGSSLPAELGQGTESNQTERFTFAPLTLRAAGPELTFQNAARLDESLERILNRLPSDTEACRDVVRGEGAVGSCVTEYEVSERIGDGLEISVGNAEGRRN